MYEYIILSGGGVNGISFIGALMCIERVYKLQGLNFKENIKGICGSSAGAIISTLFAIGMSFLEMLQLCDVCKEMFFNPPSVNLDFVREQKALVNINLFSDILERKMLEKIGKRDVTFQELKQMSGIELVVSAQCLNTASMVYFSSENTPFVSVKQATLASMSINFIFQPVEIQGDLYVDPGFIENYAVHIFKGKSNVLGLCVKGKPERVETSLIKSSLLTYCYQIFLAVFIAQEKPHHRSVTTLELEHLHTVKLFGTKINVGKLAACGCLQVLVKAPKSLQRDMILFSFVSDMIKLKLF
jgi:predicted acylesterase/phospholipase RssA